MNYALISLQNNPKILLKAAKWFHQKWNIPLEAYLTSMQECLQSKNPIPQWYLVLDKEKIIAGMGVIENDFHKRKDLTPNVCALYVEETYRCQGIAKLLLDKVCIDMKKKGIDTLYLITDHTSFYERYGWKFLCLVENEDSLETSRMYIHQEN